MIDIEKIRELARKATPVYRTPCSPFREPDSQWAQSHAFHADKPGVVVAKFVHRPWEDAEFYCAANPATVLAMIDLIDSQNAALQEAVELIGEVEGALSAAQCKRWRDRLVALSAAPSIAARPNENQTTGDDNV